MGVGSKNMIIAIGVHKNLDIEDYHGDKNSISRSSLMDFKQSPKKYWAKHLNPERPPKEIKDSWEFGTAFHTLILEPKLFEEQYFILPEKVLLKKVGREAYEEYKKVEEEAQTTKKQVLSRTDYSKLCGMQVALFSNERATRLIRNGIYESSYFWQDEHTGLIVKSRPDILNYGAYIDLKTIDDASPEYYQREMAKYGYHIQAAMTKDAVFELEKVKLDACINICVEKKYPYSVGIYIIDESAIETGQYEYKQLLLDLKTCIINNEFNDYEVQTIGLPRWY